MWPPVMLAARRIVSAKGRTNMPMISIGMRNRVTGSGRPCGTMFFQCFTNPCAFVPAMMIEKNEIFNDALDRLLAQVRDDMAIRRADKSASEPHYDGR